MSDAIPPMTFVWDGEVMKPRAQGLADKHYVVGDRYRLVPHEDRSQASHNGYFAGIAEAHASLPEHLAERLPTPEHLRKYALIRAGYRDERSIVASSKAEAVRLAAFLRPMDDFAVVTVEGAIVTVFTAKSQSYRAMGRKAFQESREAVERVLAELLGTSPQDQAA